MKIRENHYFLSGKIPMNYPTGLTIGAKKQVATHRRRTLGACYRQVTGTPKWMVFVEGKPNIIWLLVEPYPSEK